MLHWQAIPTRNFGGCKKEPPFFERGTARKFSFFTIWRKSPYSVSWWSNLTIATVWYINPLRRREKRERRHVDKTRRRHRLFKNGKGDIWIVWIEGSILFYYYTDSDPSVLSSRSPQQKSHIPLKAFYLFNAMNLPVCVMPSGSAPAPLRGHSWIEMP